MALKDPRFTTITTALLLALAYFATGRLGLLLPAFGSNITLLWLPTGIAVAALLRCGFGCWPGITLGAIAVNVAVGTPWPVALGIAVGNTLGPVLAARILPRTGFHPAFDRKRDILLLAAAAVPGMLVSASFGVAILSLAASLPEGRLAAWLIWWAGDAMGVIVGAPLVLTSTRELGRTILRHRTEFLCWLGATGLGTSFVFIAQTAPSHALAHAFVTLPLVAWAALRFGAVGTSLAIIVLSVGAACGTASGHGPFQWANPIDEALVLWSYITTCAVLGWLITALQAARVQATGGQRLFEQALTDVSLGVLLTGIDRRVTYVNEGFTRLTGYPESELLGKSCSILQGPETDSATVERLKSALRGDGSFDGEILNYRKDGTTFWNALLISPVNDERGAMTGYLGIQRDITQRKQAEQALRDSEERLRLTMSAASQGLYDLNIQTGACIVSPEYALMLGYDPGEFRETNAAWRERLHPDDREPVYQAYSEYIAGQREEYRVEFRQRTKDGGWKWILSLGSIVARTAEGQPLRMLGTHTDITERKLAEEALRSSSEFTRSLIGSMQDGFSVLDTNGVQLDVNPAFCRMTGFSREEIVGTRPPYPYWPPEEYERIQTALRETLGGNLFTFELTFMRRNGERFPVIVSPAAVRNKAGDIVSYAATVKDITERKRAEETLRQSEERFRRLIDHAPEAVVILDVSIGRFVQVNPAAERLFKCSAAELCLVGPMEMSPPTQPDGRPSSEKGREFISRAMAGETPVFEWTHRDAEGRDIPCELRLLRIEIGGRAVVRGSVTDITERKAASEALRESEVRYRKLFEANPHPMWVHDFETLRFLAVNDAAIAHYGYSREEFLAMTTTDVRPAEEIPALLAAIEEVKTGRDYTGTFRHRKRDDTVIEVEVSAHVIDFDGRRAAVVLINDVTERRRLEARSAGERAVLELLASDAPLADVLDCLARSKEEMFPGMLCSVLLLEADGKHVRHGAAPSLPGTFCRAVEGLEIGPNMGSCGTAAFTRQTTVVADIATDPLWKETRDLALAHGLRACWSVPLISSGDRVLGTFAIYYREPASPRPEEIAVIERGVHFATLAIERHELLRSLQESQTRLQTLVGNLPGMAYRCQNDPNWTMTYVSEGCEAVTGYRRDELENNRTVAYAGLIHVDDRDWLWAKCQKSLDARTPCQNEYRLLDRNGRERWVSERASGVYAADGALLAIDGFIQDITAARQAKLERELLDRKVQETQKLESLGVLAGGIAHDFNNLLTAILGNASIAQLELPPGSSVQDCLEHITEASLRAADLCKQMLAYSGRGRFVVQTLDLGELVEQTAQMLQISISKKAVLRYRLEKALPPVEVDATQIRQVIMNLVINASEAIGDASGVISISTGLTRVDRNYLHGTLMDPDLPEGEYVFIEVSDSGCGMDAETQARIFDPFFTTKFTGRGLGLAAVLGIVRGHKGAMKVYSEVGRGTTFKLLFPAADGAGETARASPAAALEWHGAGTVLVVDDEETMRSTVARMMRLMGLDPVLAVDGREAVEIFRDNPARFAFVLLDLTMPHMDGEQAFTELRRLRPEVRVVLMSGFNAHEAMLRFSGKGLASFLQKPFTIDALRTVVQGVLG